MHRCIDQIAVILRVSIDDIDARQNLNIFDIKIAAYGVFAKRRHIEIYDAIIYGADFAGIRRGKSRNVSSICFRNLARGVDLVVHYYKSTLFASVFICRDGNGVV